MFNSGRSSCQQPSSLDGRRLFGPADIAPPPLLLLLQLPLTSTPENPIVHPPARFPTLLTTLTAEAESERDREQRCRGRRASAEETREER